MLKRLERDQMAPRAHWKGYLKLSLVSCPIALFPAVSAAERVSFRQVNKQTGNRLRQQLVDTVTGDVVESADKARGYEVGQNEFLMVDDAELDAARQEARQKPFGASSAPTTREALEESKHEEGPVARSASHSSAKKASREPVPVQSEPEPPPPVRIENNHTIEIERCVDAAQIDARYHHTPYCIAPRDDVGVEAFAVIRDAMRARNVVGLGHVILSTRERPIIVAPFENGLAGITLRYAHEIRPSQEYFASVPDVELPEEMLQVAEHILQMKTADFDPALLEDRYRTALVSMLKDKQRVLPQKSAGPVRPTARNVINLMDALKRSLEADEAAARPPAKSMPRHSDAKSSVRKTAQGRARKTR